MRSTSPRTRPDRLATARRALPYAVAVAAPLAVSLLLLPWRAEVGATVPALALVAVAVAVAVMGSRGAAVVAAASATACFDFFFTVPYGTFVISNRDDVAAAAALLFVGLVASSLEARSRHRRHLVDEGRDEIARIHAVAQLVTDGYPSDEVTAVVTTELRDLLSLRSCRFDRDPGDGSAARIERNGEVTYGPLRWGVQHTGFPGTEVELPVYADGLWAGRFVMEPTPGVPVNWDRRVVAVALADQAGAALALAERG